MTIRRSRKCGRHFGDAIDDAMSRRRGYSHAVLFARYGSSFDASI